jgi:hypothetical protein
MALVAVAAVEAILARILASRPDNLLPSPESPVVGLLTRNGQPDDVLRN